MQAVRGALRRNGGQMSSSIFMVVPGVDSAGPGQLRVMPEEPYEEEAVLQRALAAFPEVLAGGTTSDGEQRKLVLIDREVGVPKTDMGSAWFSLDHLFVDEWAVPVFVEVKRSSDTRSRREVVAQLLEYAANG